MKAILNYFLNISWVLSIVMLFLSEEKKEQILILQFRAHLLFFGYDTSGMTDQEIKDGVNYMHKGLSSVGLSVSECEAALIRFGRVGSGMNK